MGTTRQISGSLFPCSSLIYGTPFQKFWLSWPSQILFSVCSTMKDCRTLFGVPSLHWYLESASEQESEAILELTLFVSFLLGPQSLTTYCPMYKNYCMIVVHSRKVSIVPVILTWTAVEVWYLFCRLSHKTFLGLSNRELQNKHPEVWYGSANRTKCEKARGDEIHGRKFRAVFIVTLFHLRAFLDQNFRILCTDFGFHRSEN